MFDLDVRMQSISIVFSPALWTELRKETRRLENKIDVKLVALSKVGSSGGSGGGSGSGFTSDTAPLLGEGVYSSLFSEISDMLDDVCTHALALR